MTERQLDRVERAIQRSGLWGLAVVTSDNGRVQYVKRVVGENVQGNHRNDRVYLRDVPSKLSIPEMVEDIVQIGVGGTMYQYSRKWCKTPSGRMSTAARKRALYRLRHELLVFDGIEPKAP